MECDDPHIESASGTAHDHEEDKSRHSGKMFLSSMYTLIQLIPRVYTVNRPTFEIT